MKKALALLVVGTIVSAVGAYAANGQTAAPAKVTLTRLHCGEAKAPSPIAAFSDTRAYDGVTKSLVSSCYLIRHGDDLMLWDTGYPAGGTATIAVPQSIVEQLRTLGIDPAKVTRVGVSHYHGDHTGQLKDFTGATLFTGAGDWAALTSTPPGVGANPAAYQHWISGGGKVEAVRGDRDVFGDGTVILIDTPGPHARPPLAVREAVEDQLPADRRPRAFRRELCDQRRPHLQHQPRRHARLARPVQGDGEEPEGDRHHPARTGGCGEAARVSKGGGVRRSSRLAVPLRRPEDVIPHLGKPTHWKAGRSAKLLAESWFYASDVPLPIRNLLDQNDDLIGAEFLDAWMERETDLRDGRATPSQTDLLALLGLRDQIAVLGIEAKVDESFGQIISDWAVRGGAGKQHRLERLCHLLRLVPSEVGHLQYQLLHQNRRNSIGSSAVPHESRSFDSAKFLPETDWLGSGNGIF